MISFSHFAPDQVTDPRHRQFHALAAVLDLSISFAPLLMILPNHENEMR